MKVICIGSSTKDIFFPTSEGVIINTPEDITSQRKIAFELGAKFKIENRYEAAGGVAANVSQGLARLGIEVGCYSKIGDDALGEWIKKEIDKEGVNTEFVKKKKDCVSDLSAIIVDSRSGERIIFSNQKANGGLEIMPDEIKNSEWIFIGDLHGEWGKILDDIFKVAEENNIKIAFNPRQSNIHDDAKKIIEAIGKCEILLVNKDEAIEIVKNSQLPISNSQLLNDEIYLIKELEKLGPAVVAITDGKRGAWARDGNKIYFSSSTENSPADTTGAGDAFSSGFLAALIRQKTTEESLKWGIANGGNVVKYYGAKEGLLSESDIIKKVETIKVMAL